MIGNTPPGIGLQQTGLFYFGCRTAQHKQQADERIGTSREDDDVRIGCEKEADKEEEEEDARESEFGDQFGI